MWYNKHMDNQNFEQQFTQNVRSSAVQPVGVESSSSSKLPLVISIALAAIILVESIALLITITNYSNAVNEYFSYDGDAGEVVDEGGVDGTTEDDYVYDDNGNLTAMEINCTNESGTKIKLDKSNKLEILDSNSNVTNSGSYTILRDSVISLTGSSNDRTFYYDGLILADGTTIYDCEETVSETFAE